jgi:antitoxin component of RelBE/YafQ-DinJ toxin-antitoxin module
MWYHAINKLKNGDNMSTKTARLTIDMERSEHKRLKMAASMMGTSIKNLVLMSVEEFMQKKPNKVTMKAMKQSEVGKGLKKFKNLDEMLEDLGI